jgi:hypothetical protein
MTVPLHFVFLISIKMRQPSTVPQTSSARSALG